MEKITEQEAKDMLEKDKAKLQKILNEGGKITKTIIEEKDKVTTITKIEPVNGEATSSTIIQTKEGIKISS